MPVSIATTRGPGLSGSRMIGSAGVTSQARSRPAIGGSASISAARVGLVQRRREHAAAHRALVADVAHQRARVDSRDRRDAAVAQPREPAALGAGRVLAVDPLAHHHRPRVDAVGLHRLRGDAVVPDQRVGEDDDLAAVARVGDRLLVARHRRVEDDLAGGGDRARRRSRRRSGCRPRAAGRPGASHGSDRERALAVGHDAVGHRHPHPPGERLPGERVVGRSGSRSRPPRPPTRRRGRPAPRRRARPARAAAPAGRTARVPAVIRSTTVSSDSTPGSTRCVCSAANAVSSPVTPIGATSNGCSFSSRACGAWSVATQSIVPERSASISASRSASERSGGFILKRLGVERLDRLVGEAEVVRGGLAGDLDARLLRLLDRGHRLARGQVLEVQPRVLEAGDRAVALDHRGLGDRRDAGEPEQRRHRALVHHAARRTATGSSSCRAISAAREPLVLERLAQHAGARAPAGRRR